MLRKFAQEQGILNYDILCGVCHQVMPEKGHVLPGSIIVGTDSHTCTYGALGAFATGVGSTDMSSVFATGKLWFMVPKTLQLMIEGRLPARRHLQGRSAEDHWRYRGGWCQLPGLRV